MANTSPMTYQQIINAIQLQTLNDPTPPVVGSQEYNIYVGMIRTLAIPTWENERGVIWDELWVNQPNYYTIAATPSTTTTPINIPLPSDFKFMYGGTIWLTYPGSTNASENVRSFKLQKLPNMELNPRNNQPEFYVTGNPVSGYNLVLGWYPQDGAAEIGATISFRYYKFANIPDVTSTNALQNPNDIPEMSDPNFIIYKVSAQVSANNFNTTLYQIMEDKANYSLLNMRMGQEMSANFQDDYVRDVDGLLGYSSYLPNRYNSGFWTNNGTGFI
jgi:hypothetical protein